MEKSLENFHVCILGGALKGNDDEDKILDGKKILLPRQKFPALYELHLQRGSEREYRKRIKCTGEHENRF